MSPAHANKKGARYRYYVSQALLQNRKAEAGSIARVPAPEIEDLVCDGIRRHLATLGKEPPAAVADRELIERHIARVIVTPQALEVCLSSEDEEAQAKDPSAVEQARCHPPIMITLSWTPPNFVAAKGVLHMPPAKEAMRPENRDALLAAVAKARRWIDEMRLGRIASFGEIAKREAQGERHIRLLAFLAFVAPPITGAILDGTAPADLTVTALAKALPYSWAEQERRFGLSR
jgi:site-specific DNA recombinase